MQIPPDSLTAADSALLESAGYSPDNPFIDAAFLEQIRTGDTLQAVADVVADGVMLGFLRDPPTWWFSVQAAIGGVIGLALYDWWRRRRVRQQYPQPPLPGEIVVDLPAIESQTGDAPVPRHEGR